MAAADDQKEILREHFGAESGIRPARSSDLREVSRFLLRAYHLDESSNLANPAFLAWKYLAPRPGWSGSRGFVLEKNGRIAAYAGVCQAWFRQASGVDVGSLTMMDWAADPSFPGTGVALFSRLMRMTDTAFIIGGSPATRAILPRIGFRIVGKALSFARWIRPWKEFRTRPLTGRSVLRLAHGFAHTLMRGSAALEVEPVAEFDVTLRSLLESSAQAITTIRRTVADLNYLLRSPAQMKGYLLREGSAVRGYCVLGRVDWEARLLDIFVNSTEQEDWSRAYAAVAATAETDPEVCRVRALATTPLHEKALRSAGYWRQIDEPIMVYDPKRLLANAFPANIQLFDGDAGY